MLTEIEDAIPAILERTLNELPKGNILVGARPQGLPAVAISNLDFEFSNAGMAEEVEKARVESQESLSGTGTQTVFKLKERPLKGSVRVEHPPGRLLAEKTDFTIDYGEGSLTFTAAPSKGRNNILLTYLSPRSLVMLKGLKLKATYSIDVWALGRKETDAIAEKVIKALLSAEGELAANGIEQRPLKGAVEAEAEGKATIMRLNYVFEKELSLEKVVGVIERVDITKKEPPATK